jgi:hypothetical protein
MNELSLVEAIDRLGEGVVVRVADAPDRGLDADLGEALRIFDRDILGGLKPWAPRSLRWTRPPRFAGLRS